MPFQCRVANDDDRGARFWILESSLGALPACQPARDGLTLDRRAEWQLEAAAVGVSPCHRIAGRQGCRSGAAMPCQVRSQASGDIRHRPTLHRLQSSAHTLALSNHGKMKMAAQLGAHAMHGHRPGALSTSSFEKARFDAADAHSGEAPPKSCLPEDPLSSTSLLDLLQIETPSVLTMTSRAGMDGPWCSLAYRVIHHRHAHRCLCLCITSRTDGRPDGCPLLTLASARPDTASLQGYR